MEVIIIILGATAVALVLILLILHNSREIYAEVNDMHDDFEKRRQNAIWATARIADSRTGIYGEMGDKASVSLTLEVTPPGRETYRAHADWLIELSSVADFSPGHEIQVKIDTQDAHIIYPASPRATYIPR